MDAASGPRERAAGRQVVLDDGEIALIRTALEMLEDTLGREEAEELAEVQSLLARLHRLESDAAGRR